MTNFNLCPAKLGLKFAKMFSIVILINGFKFLVKEVSSTTNNLRLI